MSTYLHIALSYDVLTHPYIHFTNAHTHTCAQPQVLEEDAGSRPADLSTLVHGHAPSGLPHLHLPPQAAAAAAAGAAHAQETAVQEQGHVLTTSTEGPRCLSEHGSCMHSCVCV